MKVSGLRWNPSRSCAELLGMCGEVCGMCAEPSGTCRNIPFMRGTVSSLYAEASFSCRELSFTCAEVPFLCRRLSFRCGKVSFLCAELSFGCREVPNRCGEVPNMCLEVPFLCLEQSKQMWEASATPVPKGNPRFERANAVWMQCSGVQYAFQTYSSPPTPAASCRGAPAMPHPAIRFFDVSREARGIHQRGRAHARAK